MEIQASFVLHPIGHATVTLGNVKNQLGIKIGDDEGNGLMQFDAEVVSSQDFPGELEATQLIDDWWSGILKNTGIPVTGGTDGTFWLDSPETYPRTYTLLGSLATELGMTTTMVLDLGFSLCPPFL